MHRQAKQWVACAWIAILAILFNALAPTVSHAMARGDGAAQAEICTSMGMTMAMAMDTMPAVPSHPDPAGKLDKGMTHCGYCATHAGSFGLPPTAALALGLFDTHASHPFLFFHAAHPLPVWTAPQSRAPPCFA